MPRVIYLSGVFLLFGNFSLLLHYPSTPGSGEQLVQDVDTACLRPQPRGTRRCSAETAPPEALHACSASSQLFDAASAWKDLMGCSSDFQAA